MITQQVIKKFTHDQLVNVARKWLKRECSVVTTELVAAGSESADALGFQASGFTILIECKTSVLDFRRDREKSFRRNPEAGMGARRYYLAPVGLLTPEEMPEGWGLLEWYGKRVYNRKHSAYFKERNHGREKGVLVSLIRRIGVPERGGVSIRCYQFSLYHTVNKATLGIQQEDADLLLSK